MRPKLAFVTNPLDAHFKSSISIIILELAKRLSTEFDITVYTSKGGSPDFPPGIKVRRLSVWPDMTLRRFTGKLAPLYSIKKPFFNSAIYYPFFMLQLALDIRKEGFEIVHINNFTQFLPVIKALNPDTRVVFHTHSEWIPQLDRTQIGKRVKRADLVVCCSDYLTKKASQAFPEFSSRFKTLHNGVDYGRFSQVMAEDGGAKLICVGRITPEKGLHVVIDAFNMLAPRLPGLELHLVGQERITPKEFLIDLSDSVLLKSLGAFYPGSYKERILAMIAPEQAQRVFFSGHVSHSEMLAKYSESSIFINASYYETFGMPVAEAMACGLPVIATRVGGVPEIVEDGVSGLLVEPGDPIQLAAAIERMVTDPALRARLFEAGRERVKELFSWENIAVTLKDYYREVFSPAAASR
ncbi:MAG TPA: hypothetical protein DDW94_03600 [Deltaproteobacteria bacterium]|nr:MAG: hypothetical protein A2Z79_10295 [Deltaproteobacteria bacterium GWA2_55_82]OGQ62977.1 MAG: hypothetical protein A3I81_06670 [Deltaproteobacteria bacterium RIFCSPLOWO2_02_FULL_55_12]OIJ72940.1 MAG: hypothetical protein A2V21_300910 [Deltaproteobacteria bacterium GWC2_55_46]HBG46054.1 hypothetical protein [Deltaproteobacteria bacterium]HCY11728.1 hypothetical protein [Deltaproteobacteria bacterium]